jgi:hypothetical protein
MSDDLVERCEVSAEYLRTVKAADGQQDAHFSTASVRLRQAAAEIRSLREQVEQFAENAKCSKARARLEGAEIMREAAKDAVHHSLYAVGRIKALDPAAILEAHTRAKAMGELIARDADLIDAPSPPALPDRPSNPAKACSSS